MAALNKKQVKRDKTPKGKFIARRENPEQYYTQHPVWMFSHIDFECWPFNKENVGDLFWTEILPKLKGFESQLWKDILLTGNKNNHSIDFNKLNAPAQKRLLELRIEIESIVSLRINGTHRLYGYIVNGSFNILWFDSDHGDNDTCVCRSKLKYT